MTNRIIMVKLKFIFCILSFLMMITADAQFPIYTDNSTIVTGTWNGNGTLTQTNLFMPAEGNYHYRFSYDYTNWWAGFGLNIANWGSSGYDFSQYENISISYKGISGGESLQVRLKSPGSSSNAVIVGYATGNYTDIILPLSGFTGINLTNIVEIEFFLTETQVSSGDVYVDNIYLTNEQSNPYDGSNVNHTAARTWLRYANMNKGVNFSNWLEAYWLIPFNAFPETNKYNRQNVLQLVDMGFDNVRLPVTFERIASANFPYTIPSNHAVWSLIDSAIVWAQEMDFRLIITNHHGYNITNANYVQEQERKQAIWQQIINRYSGLDEERFFFELFNEPTNEINNTNLHVFFDQLVGFIRPQLPNFTLIVGGNQWNSKNGLKTFPKLLDPDIIYTFHDYDPYAFTHAGMSWTSPPNLPVVNFPLSGSNQVQELKSSLESVKMWADTSGIPVMCGEFGCTTSANATSRCNWVETIAEANRNNGFPYYYWDAITLSDAFGFINLANNSVIPCFAQNLQLSTYNNCNLEVTSKNDFGAGSLRDVLRCASDGDVITFSNNIAGDTIILFTNAIALTKNVTLRNTNSTPIYIRPLFETTVLSIGSQTHATLENVHLIQKGSSIFDNFGTLTLKDLTIYSNASEEMDIMSDGAIIIQGEVEIKQY